jgi:hypothetical protein
VPAGALFPGRLPFLDIDDPWPADDYSGQSPDDSLDDLLAHCPDLAEDAWLADDTAGADDPEPAVREVLKAGFWDRTCGDGAGFAAGGVTDRVPPGPVLAGFAADAWADGLDRLTDDELIGVLRAARRLASWAGAMELAAAGDLWCRRTAEEDAGDTGAACHADDEIAAALTLTAHAAERVLALAIGMGRLPATAAVLANGDIDLPRAAVIADEVTGLADAHAAAVDRAVAAAAPGLTTGRLRAATRRAVQAADPEAARKRKEEALREARVERWDEPAGTAALAGRDLPPASVLTADHHLTALAEELKAAGADGTLDTLRAHVYLALLSGNPVSSLLPAGSATPGESPQSPTPREDFGGAGQARGSVHLTLPLSTWLGLGEAPGQVAGFGPVDATDARDLARALAAHPGTRWCLTFADRDGRPLVHGCANAGPPGRRRTRRGDRPQAGPAATARDGLGPESGDRPGSMSHDRPGTKSRDRPDSSARAGPGTSSRDQAWTLTFTVLDSGDCGHAWETPAYQPTDRLRHLVHIRHATCTFPGCRRPARQCDADHTLAYDDGGKTCLCNLAPLCRRHHQVKQAPGWALEQTSPGVMTWTTPAGRRYTVTPTEYPA